jgi:hypothetical protein
MCLSIQIDELERNVEAIQKLFFDNLVFVANYLQGTWESTITHMEKLKMIKSPIGETSSKRKRKFSCKTVEEVNSVTLIQTVLSCIGNITTRIDDYNFQLNQKAEEGLQERLKLDYIAAFNVEGERISVVKSTLLQIIPESQLTIRVASGRWEEHNFHYSLKRSF